MSILITGGTGFIGSNLARTLVEEGRDVILLDVKPNLKRIADISGRVRVLEGDLSLWQTLISSVKEYGVEEIYHLAAYLSAASEESPLRVFNANFIGTLNVLEAARIFDLEKVIYSSSLASFGPGLPQPVANDAKQEPRTVYGISKVFSELYGLYYHHRYGLDFRALRLPSVVGPGRNGGGASAYSTLIIQRAAEGSPYKIEVGEDTRMPIIYILDAVRAFLILHDAKAPKTRVYNIAGISPTAKEIVDAVRKFIPDAQLTFEPKPEIVRIVDSWPQMIDDRVAREELGWKLSYPLRELVEDFIGKVRSQSALRG
jgi:threonine 3-dehydrogenase